MHQLHFSFSSNYSKEQHAQLLEEMREWMVENNYRHVTHDTMVMNHCLGAPSKYFRIRESVRDGQQYVVSCSHPEIMIHFKLRWSDHWV